MILPLGYTTWRVFIPLITGFLLISSGVTHAAPRDGGSGAADAGVKRLLQQLSAERDALQAKNLELEAQLDALSKDIEKLTIKMQRRDDTLAAYKKSNTNLVDRLKDSIAQGRGLTSEVRSKNEEIVQRDIRIEQLEARVDTLASNLQHHLQNNRRLVEISNELVMRYQNKGFVENIKRSEPLTGLSRVDLENLIQEYQFEIEDLVLESADATTASKF